MKSVAILTLLAGSAAAFSPAPVSKAATSLKVSADLQGMVGASAETGNKIVSCWIGSREAAARRCIACIDHQCNMTFSS